MDIKLWLSLILGNVIMLLNYLLLMCGLRAFYKEPVMWAKHFWFSALQFLDSYKLLEEMKVKNNLLACMAHTDNLTGIYNRCYLEENINDYMQISDRSGVPISFILIDLDHFKEVNYLFCSKSLFA